MNCIQGENSIFSSSLPQMSCKEIFQTVSDALGEHYKKKGLKYSRSYPKLVYKDTQIKLEICFWSSHSNIPDNYVCFEVIPSFYSVKLKNMGKNGFICGHNDVFHQPQKQKYHFNIYNLSIDEFSKISALIDSTVLPWIEKLKTPEGVSEMLHIKEGRYTGNSVFLDYVQLNFSDLAAK